MTFSNTVLRIMQVPYHNHHHEKEPMPATISNQDDSLMSPPLTPTDAHHPPPTILSSSLWDFPSTKNRKQFIESYSRMVPSLRQNSNCIDTNERTFALNVYRDLLITKKQQEQEDKIKDCTMLDKKTIVPHTKKRKLVISANEVKDKQNAPQKRKRVSSVLPSGKDAALAFDAIDIDTCDYDFYPQGWVPLRDALNQVPVKVSWKGAPLSVEHQPYFEELHPVEATMASVLRLSPVQYLRCKRTLILAARTLEFQQIPFTKSVAQKLCRVDVNKTSALWTAFGQLGWFTANDDANEN